VITDMVRLPVVAGGLGPEGFAITAIGLSAPQTVHLFPMCSSASDRTGDRPLAAETNVTGLLRERLT